MIITPGNEARNLRHLAKTAPYATRRPATRGDAQMIHRLAVKAQMLAAEYGEDLTWREAIIRARHNLVFVRGWAAANGGTA